MKVPLGWKVDKTGRIMIFFKTDKFKLLKQGQFWLNENISKPGVSFGSTDIGNIRGLLWVKLQEKDTKKVFYITEQISESHYRIFKPNFESRLISL